MTSIRSSLYSEKDQGPTYMRDGRAPIPVKNITSRIMSSIRGKNTRPEVELKKALRKAGIKGIIPHIKDLPGRPDIAIKKMKLAIFMHGCFWHQCQYCRPPLPKTHKTFWKKKFDANKRRDSKKIAQLRALGWSTLTVWECQWKRSPKRQLARILNAVHLTDET
jgi:DNA mismatch endonuclease (patch repair protein)